MSIEHREFRASVRKLAQTKIAPHAADVDDKERFPSESWAALCSNDLPGLAHPESLGGSGADLLSQVIAVEEVAASCASSALVMLVNWAGTSTVLSQGSDELKQLVVPGVASGSAGAAWCMTEPRVGSDLSAIATTAIQDGSDWILNGRSDLSVMRRGPTGTRSWRRPATSRSVSSSCTRTMTASASARPRRRWECAAVRRPMSSSTDVGFPLFVSSMIQ